jgi:hypothetical protein
MGAERERGAREGWEGARGSGRLGAGEAQGGEREGEDVLTMPTSISE